MKNIFKALSFSLIFFISGCATGPIGTPAFEKFALEQINDGSDKILYEKAGARSWKNEKLAGGGTFVITKNGVYLLQWDEKNYKYEVFYNFPMESIESVTNKDTILGALANFHWLVIKSKNNIDVSFSHIDRLAAKKLIELLIEE